MEFFYHIKATQKSGKRTQNQRCYHCFFHIHSLVMVLFENGIYLQMINK
jgi:hypothetical protein